jgi:hypothetical protein
MMSKLAEGYRGSGIFMPWCFLKGVTRMINRNLR